MFVFNKILFFGPLTSRFRFPSVSSPQTEKTRSYASSYIICTSLFPEIFQLMLFFYVLTYSFYFNFSYS